MNELNPEKLSSSEKKDILQELETDHADMRRNQAEIRRRWIKTQGAVEGRQLFTQGGSNFEGVIGQGWEQAGASSATNDVDDEHAIFNELRRVYNTDMQRLTGYYLRPDVVPDTKNAQMKQGARVGRIFLADHIRKTGGEAMKATIARSLILRNISILKVHYDPHAGRMLKQPARGILGLFGLGNKLKPEGEMKWSFPNPKCVLLPKYCKSPETAHEVSEYHVDHIQNIYRQTGVVVEAETVDPDYYDALDAGLKSKDVEGGASGYKTDNMAVLKEKIIMPCPRYPKGAMFTWVSKQLIRSDILRYPGNPYFSAQLLPNDETAFCDSILWDLLPVQGYLNLGLSQTGRWLKMVGQLRRWIPTESGIKQEDLDNSTGMNSFFSGGKPPIWDQVPEINESIFKTIELYRNFLASHGYANELAKQARAMSGNALGMLQEVDDTIFKPGLEQVQSMLSRASSFTLEVAATAINTPRLIKMTSMQGWQIVEGFKGEMLQGNFHTEINLMAGMPQNKVLRLEYLKSLFKDGLLSREQTQAYLEFPSDNQEQEDAQKQYEIADKRIQDLLAFPDNYEKGVDPESGQPMWICKIHYHQFDNHQLMAQKLQTAMQESFDHWPQFVGLAFLEHWNYANMQLAEQAKAQMQAQMDAELMKSLRNGKGGMQDAINMEQEMLAPKPQEQGLAPDSNQSAEQQPDRSQIPDPMSTGFTQ